MAGGPVRNRELISHHQPEEFGKDQKETQHVWPPPRILLSGVHLDWTRRAPPGKTESEWLAKNNLETNPITIKPKTASHVAEQFSWVPLPYCSPPGYPSPIKSLALSACVSPRTIHFRVLDKSPVSGPGRGPPSCNNDVFFFFFLNSLLYLICHHFVWDFCICVHMWDLSIIYLSWIVHA